MKEKSRNAVAKLIKTLNTLLTIYIIFGFITGIIAALFKSPYWWVLIIAMLPSAVIFGVLVTQLSDALNSIIEDMEKSSISAKEGVGENNSQPKKVNRVKSKPEIDVMSDDYDTFCEKVNSALDGVSRYKQIDWLAYWLEELEAKCAETTDADKQYLYNEQIAYLDLSLKSLS